VKVNVSLELVVIEQLIELLEFKEIFAWTYKGMKGIPLKIIQHKIEFDTMIPLARQVKYWLNPNYGAIVKQDINKLWLH